MIKLAERGNALKEECDFIMNSAHQTKKTKIRISMNSAQQT